MSCCRDEARLKHNDRKGCHGLTACELALNISSRIVVFFLPTFDYSLRHFRWGDVPPAELSARDPDYDLRYV